MTENIKATIIGVGMLGVAVTGSIFGAQEPKITFDPATAQVVRWDKPKTDAEWAEDVKQEQFDMRSTAKLTDMASVHKEKLKRVEAGKAEVFECPECIRFQAKKGHPEWTTAEIEAYYQDELAKAHWEVEKLKQSIERMDKELELRNKKFVIVPSEGDTQPLLGSVDQKYVRNKIID